jgi:AAHS family 4-hydroxybenzoate transporter-like MFS transporter
MIGLSENGLWLMALAIFGTGIGISGSQVGLNALTATLYPTQSRATGVSWSNAVGRCGAIVGSLSGGVMMAMNFSFIPCFLLLPFRPRSARDAYPADACRPPLGSVPDALPSAGIVNK